jgi:hypothetical protein
MSGIGLLNEKPLHAALKEWYAGPRDQLEVTVDGYVVDIVQGDLLVEIQTSNFASIKTKLMALSSAHRVRLVYPIAREKWIIKLARGRSSKATRRKSPKRGRVEDVFWEMVSFPQLLARPNFSLEVLLIREEEVRRYEGKRKWRSRGWVTEERRLLEVVGRMVFEGAEDLGALLPEGLDGEFTTRELAEAIGRGRTLAQKMAYCLRQVRAIECVGKRGRANLYRVAGA